MVIGSILLSCYLICFHVCETRMTRTHSVSGRMCTEKQVSGMQIVEKAQRVVSGPIFNFYLPDEG